MSLTCSGHGTVKCAPPILTVCKWCGEHHERDNLEQVWLEQWGNGPTYTAAKIMLDNPEAWFYKADFPKHARWPYRAVINLCPHFRFVEAMNNHGRILWRVHRVELRTNEVPQPPDSPKLVHRLPEDIRKSLKEKL